MNKEEIEIPYKHERGRLYKFFEKAPAIVTYIVLLTPVILSYFSTTAAAIFIISYIIIWFFKAMAMSYRVLQGYSRMKLARNLDWTPFLKDVDDPEKALANKPEVTTRWQDIHYKNLENYIKSEQKHFKTDEIINVAMVATYNESIDILEPTIQAVVNSKGNHKEQTVLMIAYEERGGEDIEKTVKKLIKKYGDNFLWAKAVKHPKDIEGEVIGKGGNITYAGWKLKDWLDEKEIDYERVVVTTLDADNKVDPNYFASVIYTYILSEDRKYKSFQPIPMYFKNIWDVPAPMRIIATGNSFWMVVTATRPHLLRNFSAHAQPMSALVETNFWSVRSIVEDGHQYWRTYMRFNGKHDVLPIYVPVHQDAVLADGYFKTYKAQFIQLRRWAYGASDIPYVAIKGFFTKNKIPKTDLILKFGRLVEGHISWATSALIIAFSGWIPLLFNPESDLDVVAHQLPDFVAWLQRIATLGILVTMYLGITALPKRPDRVPRRQSALMWLQWVLLPLTTIVFNTFAALYSQTRLLFGRYLDKFDVTEKAVKN